MPTVEITREFINCVDTFIRQHPTEIIGVHCTHGFNQTGFLICAYLFAKRNDLSNNEKIIDKVTLLKNIVSLFAEVRPPGVYKQEYIDELFKRYAGVQNVYIYLNYKEL